ncbi:MAG: DoxX family membrane protein, partial [Tannerella sp.]|nr:DoxX family membrane protein [Tannerella sp.]
MKNMKAANKRKKRVIEITAECCRVLLGLTFVFSGIVKAIDPVGGALKIEEYLVVFGLDSFSWLSISISIAQAALEFTLGFCLLMGVYRRLTTLLLLIFMCFFTPLTLYIAIFNPVADCGCFGDALIITNWQTFFKNIVLLAAAIFVYIYCKHLASIYSYRTYWFVALFACIFCVSFCYYNYSHLPIIDFLPYKVGENIPKLMEFPPDAPQDVYHFIYQKDGVKKEFALADAPVSDSTWT